MTQKRTRVTEENHPADFFHSSKVFSVYEAVIDSKEFEIDQRVFGKVLNYNYYFEVSLTRFRSNRGER